MSQCSRSARVVLHVRRELVVGRGVYESTQCVRKCTGLGTVRTFGAVVSVAVYRCPVVFTLVLNVRVNYSGQCVR